VASARAQRRQPARTRPRRVSRAAGRRRFHGTDAPASRPGRRPSRAVLPLPVADARRHGRAAAATAAAAAAAAAAVTAAAALPPPPPGDQLARRAAPAQPRARILLPRARRGTAGRSQTPTPPLTRTHTPDPTPQTRPHPTHAHAHAHAPTLHTLTPDPAFGLSEPSEPRRRRRRRQRRRRKGADSAAGPGPPYGAAASPPPAAAAPAASPLRPSPCRAAGDRVTRAATVCVCVCARACARVVVVGACLHTCVRE
jgi:hypothetical protein